MKPFLKALAVFALGAALSVQPLEARDRHHGARGRNHPEAQQRPSSSRHSNRPGAGNGNTAPKHGKRPDKHNKHDAVGKPHDKHRPARPTPPKHDKARPHKGGPGYGDRRPGGRPGQRPLPPSSHHYGHVPRPHRPWSRPVPPPKWRPRPGMPGVGTILGLTIGTAFNATLNYLSANNYVTTGYTPDEIIVSDVPMYGYRWPTARLLYRNGALYGSQYVYPASRYDNSRYSSLYNHFCNMYGMPVSVSNNGSSCSSTWFGGDSGFITLSLEPLADQYGRVRYFTSVTMGG